jgi:tRNA (mo5U34)-methyltransferase
MENPNIAEITRQMNQLSWYHTIDLGNGLRTPGYFDHRPILHAFGLPKDLRGRTALDIGAASGFFTFELEKRGAQVTSTELPNWINHDFGPLHKQNGTLEEAQLFLHDPFLFAHKQLGSKAKRQLINIYDISPETVGVFDLVFCGSLLLHLTDPVKALWRIQSVTRELAIIETVIHPLDTDEPLALFNGKHHGDVWWLPNRKAFEMMVKSAGFQGWEWFSAFQINTRDGVPGPYHAVIRAWNTPNRPGLLANTDHADQPLPDSQAPGTTNNPDVQNHQALVKSYGKMRNIRNSRRFESYKQKVRNWLHKTASS